MTLSVSHTQQLSAPAALVWSALTEAEALRAWFAEHALIDLRTDGAYRFWGRHTLGAPSSADATQRITALVPGASLAFSWTLHGVATSVTLSLATTDEGTTLGVRHDVDGELPVPRAREYVEDHWRFQCANLVAHLGGGPGLMRPDFTDPAPEIRMSIDIAAPHGVVWETLLDPVRVAEWFGAPNVRIDAKPDGEYRVGWEYKIDGRDVVGGSTRILAIEPQRRLVLDWPDWRGDETVTGQWIGFTLDGDGDRTTVYFVHGGFTRTADLSDYPFGWVWFTGEFRRVAERQMSNGGAVPRV